MKLIVFIGFFLGFSSFSLALVPVEGIIMGEAREEIQNDPLRAIFSEIYDKSLFGENKKLKLYQSTYESGQYLSESCSYLGQTRYATPWQEKQARRSVTATLQYIGLDTTIKAIGAYSRKFDLSEEDFRRLKGNLILNYCSRNITSISIRSLDQSFDYYYKNPLMELIPSISTSPFATEMMKTGSEKTSARSREFDLVIRSFRAFCSWGGDTEDYRLLSPYLNNRFIMSFVFKNMAGLQDKIDEKVQKVTTVSSSDTVQVLCTDLICRKESQAVFKNRFPLSIGSTGVLTDLSKQYCHHFRFQDVPQKTIPEVREWVKAQELEDPIFETSQFIALMTGVPDFFQSVDAYIDIPLMARSSIDERWAKWARTVLNSFSHDLLFEESFKVKVEPRRNLSDLSGNGFGVDFSVTLGELDRLVKENDKIDVSFELKLSKNYLRELRTKIVMLQDDLDFDGQKKLKEETASYLNIQLKEKEKLFAQKLWNEDFGRLIAEELILQTKHYQGELFKSYQDEVLRVPVRFSYGLFALSYLKYRSDVTSGRVKLSF